LIAEFVVQENTDLREFLTRNNVRAVDGHLPVPDAPGLGIELDEEQVGKFRVA
jgi:L-alanine-DL-glutamate epimerase-like enolase superfamily enzyme